VEKFPIDLFGELVAVLPADVRQGAIFVPDWSRCLHGAVLAIGPDVKDVKVGDTVYFRATSGMEATCNGQAIRVMKEEADIDCVVDHDA
jgi:co-chaperonin GroES (HSP10)